MALDEIARLPCGVDVARLVDQVADGLTPEDPDHQEGCPYCQGALAELRELWGDVRELAREEVPVPQRVVRRVLEQIRRERAAIGVMPALPLEQVVPRLVRYALLEAHRGRTRIADSVIARIARRAALDSPAVRRLGRLPPGMAPRLGGGSVSGLGVEVDGARVSVRVGLVVAYGYPLEGVAADARQRVIDALRALTELEVTAVDILIADLEEPG